MLETLDYTIRIGSTPTILYFDLYLYSAYAAHYCTSILLCLPLKLYVTTATIYPSSIITPSIHHNLYYPALSSNAHLNPHIHVTHVYYFMLSLITPLYPLLSLIAHNYLLLSIIIPYYPS